LLLLFCLSSLVSLWQFYGHRYAKANSLFQMGILTFERIARSTTNSLRGCIAKYRVVHATATKCHVISVSHLSSYIACFGLLGVFWGKRSSRHLSDLFGVSCSGWWLVYSSITMWTETGLRQRQLHLAYCNLFLQESTTTKESKTRISKEISKSSNG
jgi:hypothetical protein